MILRSEARALIARLRSEGAQLQAMTVAYAKEAMAIRIETIPGPESDFDTRSFDSVESLERAMRARLAHGTRT